MALWGNKDNVSVQNGAKVALNYATKTLTGTGTTFGTDGYGVEGDVIRIGYTTAVTVAERAVLPIPIPLAGSLYPPPCTVPLEQI